MARRRPSQHYDQGASQRRRAFLPSASSPARQSTSISRCCFRSRPTRTSSRPICPVSKQAAAEGKDLSHIASVASFFVSRIDAAVDKRITRCWRWRPPRRARRCRRSLSPTAPRIGWFREGADRPDESRARSRRSPDRPRPRHDGGSPDVAGPRADARRRGPVSRSTAAVAAVPETPSPRHRARIRRCRSRRRGPGRRAGSPADVIGHSLAAAAPSGRRRSRPSRSGGS